MFLLALLLFVAFCPSIFLSMVKRVPEVRAATGQNFSIIQWREKVATPGEACIELNFEASGRTWGKNDASEGAILVELSFERADEPSTAEEKFYRTQTFFVSDELRDYALCLGEVKAGPHVFKLRFSSDGSGLPPKLAGTRLAVFAPNTPEHDRVSSAPILFYRKDSIARRTDIPIFVWAENQGEDRFIYHTVFSHEDSRSAWEALRDLMVTYGRTADIEWSYEGNRFEGFYQTAAVRSDLLDWVGHSRAEFQGKRWRGHPVLRTVGAHNVFDSGGIPDLETNAPHLILWPQEGRKKGETRERRVDREPWIEGVTLAELKREKLVVPGITPELLLTVDGRLPKLVSGMRFSVSMDEGKTWVSSPVKVHGGMDREGGAAFRSGIPLPDAPTGAPTRLRVCGAIPEIELDLVRAPMRAPAGESIRRTEYHPYERVNSGAKGSEGCLEWKMSERNLSHPNMPRALE